MTDQIASDEDLITRCCCDEENDYCFDNAEDTTKHSAETEIEGLINRVISIYHAGTSFYSTDAMRDLLAQIDSDSSEITVRTIDDKLMSFQRRTGRIADWEDVSIEYDWIIGHPFIRFISLQEMLDQVRQYQQPLSLCSMWVFHNLLRRRRSAAGPCDRQTTQSREEVVQFFETKRKEWEASQQCLELGAILRNVVLSRITKIVAFACGGMAFSDRIPWSTRSACQHALILTMKQIIDAQNGQADMIKCYVQDPIYCDLDRDVLNLYQIEVLDSPRGFLEVDDTTIVLSFSPDAPIRQIIADIASPAMMIWDQCATMSDEIVDSQSTDPDSPRLTQLLRNLYTEFEFPRHHDAFEGQTILVRSDRLLHK